MVREYSCYKYSKNWFLVEMVLDVKPSEIEFENIVVPDKLIKKSNWQCPYMEQYLNAEGTKKICETYDEPEEEVNPCRVAFFIYKEGSRTLRTPYGDFDLTNIEKLPKRLKSIIEFEED
jgi:hypothetical protein